MTKTWKLMCFTLALFLTAQTGIVLTAQSDGQIATPTVFYFVRHGEVTNGSLNVQGRERARVLAKTLREVHFTNIFASHTARTREMVEPIAAEQKLPVIQLPQPGTVIGAVTVREDSPTNLAAKPMIEALKRVAPGSTVLVAGNRDNIFAVLNGLGVPLCNSATTECVPCLTSACYGEWYDRLWILTVTPGAKPRLMELHYS
jgi:hypothetical protein